MDKQFPDWHDADGWMAFVEKAKAAMKVDGVIVQIETRHGTIIYGTEEHDGE